MQIPIRKGWKKIIAYAIVDDEDYERLNKSRWSLQATGYPQAWDIKTKKTRTMHQFVLNLASGYRNKLEVSHLNQNKLDNRKCNLKITNRQENSRNQSIPQKNSTTGYLNVHKLKNGYQVRIFGKYYGFFKNLKEAGEFAKKKRKELL